jgi:hypothetical protein
MEAVQVATFIRAIAGAYNSAKQLEFIYFCNPFIFSNLVGNSGSQFGMLLGRSTGPINRHAIDVIVLF